MSDTQDRMTEAQMALSALIGERVSVTVSSVPFASNHFKTAMSVTGVLESASANRYRVVVDDSTYTYFTDQDVYAIIGGRHVETGDSRWARIYIEVQTPLPRGDGPGDGSGETTMLPAGSDDLLRGLIVMMNETPGVETEGGEDA